MKFTLPARSNAPRLWFDRAQSGLRAWASTETNPFLARAWRVEARGLALFKSLLSMAALYAILFGFGWFLLATDSSLRGRYGARVADGAALLLVSVVLGVAWLRARASDSTTIQVDVLKNRLEPIQLAPLSAEARAWWWSAPGTLSGLLLCLAMLPGVAWQVGMGRFAWDDLLGLLCLIALTMYGAPTWSPTLWRAQAERTATRRDARLKSDGFALPNDLQINARGWGWLSGAAWLYWMLGARGGGLFVAPVAYWQQLPAQLRAMSDDILISWPLFLARWLVWPQPFFGVQLAPILILVPFWLAFNINRVARLGAVTGLESQFWTPPRVHRWRMFQSVQAALGWLLILGLLWPGAIGEKWLAFWFDGITRTPANALSHALGAWWVIALICGALSTTAMWRATLELPLRPGTTLRDSLAPHARRAAWGLVVTSAFWALGCALGRVWPFDPLWRQIALPSLAVAAIWMGAQIIVWAGLSLKKPFVVGAFAALHLIWFYAAPLLFGALVVLTQTRPADIAPELLRLSPWTLWLSLRDPNVGADPEFWKIVGAHLALIALGNAIVWRLSASALTETRPLLWTRLQQTVSKKSLASTRTSESLAPAIVEAEAPLPKPKKRGALAALMASAPATLPGAGASVTKRAPLATPDARLQRLLNWLGRFDNPILILETRRALADDFRKTMTTILWLEGLCALAMWVGLPFFGLWFGIAIDVGQLVVAWTIVAIGALCLWGGSFGAAKVYDRDRLDGSLQMLFLTPRTEREIAGGKFGPFLLRPAILFALWSPVLVATLIFSVAMGWSWLILAIFVVPLWMVPFLLRHATFEHFAAAKSRKIGPGNSILGMGILGFCVEILALVAYVSYFSDTFSWPVVVALPALLLPLIYLAEARLLWNASVSDLRRQRLRERVLK